MRDTGRIYHLDAVRCFCMLFGLMVHGSTIGSGGLFDVIKATSEHFGLKQADLISERRNRSIARPRQAAMWLAKQLTTRSLPDIGRRFGGRDHTTVLHAVRRIEALKADDPVLARDLEALVRKLRG